MFVFLAEQSVLSKTVITDLVRNPEGQMGNATQSTCWIRPWRKIVPRRQESNTTMQIMHQVRNDWILMLLVLLLLRLRDDDMITRFALFRNVQYRVMFCKI